MTRVAISCGRCVRCAAEKEAGLRISLSREGGIGAWPSAGDLGRCCLLLPRLSTPQHTCAFTVLQ